MSSVANLPIPRAPSRAHTRAERIEDITDDAFELQSIPQRSSVDVVERQTSGLTQQGPLLQPFYCPKSKALLTNPYIDSHGETFQVQRGADEPGVALTSLSMPVRNVALERCIAAFHNGDPDWLDELNCPILSDLPPRPVVWLTEARELVAAEGEHRYDFSQSRQWLKNHTTGPLGRENFAPPDTSSHNSRVLILRADRTVQRICLPILEEAEKRARQSNAPRAADARPLKTEYRESEVRVLIKRRSQLTSQILQIPTRHGAAPITVLLDSNGNIEEVLIQNLRNQHGRASAPLAVQSGRPMARFNFAFYTAMSVAMGGLGAAVMIPVASQLGTAIPILGGGIAGVLCGAGIGGIALTGDRRNRNRIMRRENASPA